MAIGAHPRARRLLASTGVLAATVASVATGTVSFGLDGTEYEICAGPHRPRSVPAPWELDYLSPGADKSNDG